MAMTLYTARMGSSQQPQDAWQQQREEFESRLTPEQLAHIKRWRMIWLVPVRLFISITFFSFMAGGYSRMFTTPPGIAFAVLFAIQVVVEKLVQAPDAGGKRKDQGSVVILWIGLGSCFFLSLIDWFWIRPTYAPIAWSFWWLAAGILVFALGQTLRVVAIRTLGRFFTISVRLHEGQQVIQQGVYKRVRHPAYSALLLVILGHVTLFASLWGYLAFVVLAIPAMANRIRVEERALKEQFGEEYAAYCRRSKRLIPFLL